MRPQQLVVDVGIREPELVIGLGSVAGSGPAAELPHAAMVDDQRGLQLVEQLLELVVAEVEMPEAHELLVAGGRGAQRRLQRPAVARKDRVRRRRRRRARA